MTYARVDEFLSDWRGEAAKTAKVFGALTDGNLAQPVADGHRTLGRIAWHLVTTIPEMMSKTGLGLSAVDEHAPVPPTAAAIVEAYEAAANELAECAAASWSDETLAVEDSLYGMAWKRGLTAKCLVMHQAHHRGQMSVLLRQAGVPAPDVYGPVLEAWETMGMKPPEV